MVIVSKKLVAVFGSALPSEQGGDAIPVQFSDYGDTSYSTQEDLEQHTPTARVKIGLYRHFKRYKEGQQNRVEEFVHVKPFLFPSSDEHNKISGLSSFVVDTGIGR